MWDRCIERNGQRILRHVDTVTELRPKLPSVCGCGVVELAESASTVQAIDDRIATTILCSGIVSLGRNIVGAVAEWSKFVDGIPKTWSLK